MLLVRVCLKKSGGNIDKLYEVSPNNCWTEKYIPQTAQCLTAAARFFTRCATHLVSIPAARCGGYFSYTLMGY